MPFPKVSVKGRVGCILLTPKIGYLNEVELWPRCKKSLDLQVSSLVSYFKKISAFVVFAIFSHESVHDKR